MFAAIAADPCQSAFVFQSGYLSLAKLTTHYFRYVQQAASRWRQCELTA